MQLEYTITGTALMGDLFEPRPVTIVVEKGIITRVEDESDAPNRWICPAFFNGHTHLADTVAMDLPCTGSLEELVTPPNGLKHRILAESSSEHLISGMRASITTMIASGTSGFADFREGGIEGVMQLKIAAAGLPCRPVILGRGGGEKAGDGAGISSTRDVPLYESIAREMRHDNRLVAFHAGERDGTDIDAALSCEPDLLVHCTHADHRQLRSIADAGIPVVICARSNFLLNVAGSAAHPPVREMVDLGIDLLLGTDNVMFVQPDIFREMAFLQTIYQVPSLEILRAATRGLSKDGCLNEIMPGKPANFFVVDKCASNLSFSHDIVSSLVKRAESHDICARIF
ncbi:MAG TPA: amidohydrolase family protein [Methanospirillum sp.]|nr:amidohydrolase family protein [Methanospirillum sp.]